MSAKAEDIIVETVIKKQEEKQPRSQLGAMNYQFAIPKMQFAILKMQFAILKTQFAIRVCKSIFSNRIFNLKSANRKFLILNLRMICHQ